MEYPADTLSEAIAREQKAAVRCSGPGASADGQGCRGVVWFSPGCTHLVRVAQEEAAKQVVAQADARIAQLEAQLAAIKAEKPLGTVTVGEPRQASQASHTCTHTYTSALTDLHTHPHQHILTNTLHGQPPASLHRTGLALHSGGRVPGRQAGMAPRVQVRD